MLDRILAGLGLCRANNVVTALMDLKACANRHSRLSDRAVVEAMLEAQGKTVPMHRNGLHAPRDPFIKETR